MAAVVGVSVVYFDRDIRKLLPKGSERQDGRRLMFHGPAVIAALVDREKGKAARAGIGVDPDEAAVFAGEDSPALERLRLAKAQLAEMDLEAKRGNLIPREALASGMASMAMVLRRAGEVLQRQHGRDAHQVLEEALNEIDGLVQSGQIYGNRSMDNQSNQ